MTSGLAALADFLRGAGCDPMTGPDGETEQARCPVAGQGKGNGDRNPSLGYGGRPDGFAWLHCHASCQNDDVLASIGLSRADLLLRPRFPGQAKRHDMTGPLQALRPFRQHAGTGRIHRMRKGCADVC